MAAWVEDSLAESMVILKSIGRDRLAEEMCRILQIIKADDDVPWFYEQSTQDLLEDIYLIQYTRDCSRILNQIRDVFSVEQCALFRLAAGTDRENRLLCSTSPGEWWSESEANRYLDPYLEFARKIRRTFFWDEVSGMAQRTLQFPKIDNKGGIESAGFSFVSPIADGDLMVIAVRSRQTYKEFRREFERKLDDISAVCRNLIGAFVTISRREETWRRGHDHHSDGSEPERSSNNVIWTSGAFSANASRRKNRCSYG